LIDVVDNINSSSAKLNSDLDKIGKWTRDRFVTINPSKTESMIFWTKRNKVIKFVPNHQHLGITLSSNLSWREHVMTIYGKVSKTLNLLKGLKLKINRDTLVVLYKCLIQPKMEYAEVVWDGCSDGLNDLLESVQYEAAKLVTGAMKGTSQRKLLDELAWEEL
jgi:hypothetical protein